MNNDSWDNFSIPNKKLYRAPVKIFYADTQNEYQTLYLSVPKNIDGNGMQTVVWFHGGGLYGSFVDDLRALYNGKHIVASARYRIIPEAPFPAQLEDAASAIAWAFKNTEQYGGRREKIVSGGMSAGAYLAAMTGTDKKYLAEHSLSPESLAGLLLVSGQMTTHFQVKKELGYPGDNAIPAIDEYAPIRHFSKTMPPVLFVTGAPGLDMPGRAHENMFAADILRMLGHSRAEIFVNKACGHSVTAAKKSVVNKFLDSL